MDFDRTNALVKSKVAAAVSAMKARQSSLGMKHGQNTAETDRLTKITTTTRQTAGLISRVRFRFKRSGIFVHKGVGRGTTASQVGSTSRKAKEWFNPIIQKLAEELEDEVFDSYIDVNLKNLGIK